jgi:hypothetical protein
VLPILNNLLENREMALEVRLFPFERKKTPARNSYAAQDGRFLMHPTRFDALARSDGLDMLHRMRILRVSERFRVIALGLPVRSLSAFVTDY